MIRCCVIQFEQWAEARIRRVVMRLVAWGGCLGEGRYVPDGRLANDVSRGLLGSRPQELV